MAYAAKRPCNKPLCPELVGKGYCEKHATEKRKAQDSQRLSSNDRGYTSKWRKARRYYLDNNPLCVRCKAQGITKAANVVDHIEPHKGNMDLFWSKDNWCSLCTTCHNSKTATEDGGFGRPIKKT